MKRTFAVVSIKFSRKVRPSLHTPYFISLKLRMSKVVVIRKRTAT